MSTPEQAPNEPRSSVKLSRNAKGDPQWEIRVVVGESEEEVETARSIALSQYRDLEAEFGAPA